MHADLGPIVHKIEIKFLKCYTKNPMLYYFGIILDLKMRL